MKIYAVAFVLVLGSLVTFGFFLPSPQPMPSPISYSDSNLLESTVMITNLTSNSGGTGSIVFTSDLYSEVLTNGHVCEVVKAGGLVHTQSLGEHLAIFYKASQVHDLCLIKVFSNLKFHSNLASRPEAPYEEAMAIGHPHLLPTIVTKGHFSGKKVVQIIMGMRDCTEEDRSNPGTGFLCELHNKVPIVKTFESLAISATIQPGSSGSAVYNSAKEIEAVVFAGAGDLSYGLSVPYEYVANFLLTESKSLPYVLIDKEVKLSTESSQSYYEKIKDSCKNATTEPQKQFCKIVTSSTNLVF